MVMTQRDLAGKAGEYRVLSELLKRDIYASPYIVDDGGDLFLNNGKIIQVRSRRMDYLGNAKVVLTKTLDYDFLIVWSWGKKDYFYIIPKKAVDGITSVCFNPEKKRPLEFHKYLDNWKILGESKPRQVVLNRKVTRSQVLELGKIVKSPTPEETRIAKEKKPDHSLEGVLKKTKTDEVSN